MKRWKLLLALGAAVGWLSGCGDSVESLTGSYVPATDASGLVAFSQVQPTLLEKCAICHGEYVDSAKIVNGDVKGMYKAVYGYYMPASGVSQLAPQDRIALLAWLKQVEAQGLGKGK